MRRGCLLHVLSQLSLLIRCSSNCPGYLGGFSRPHALQRPARLSVHSPTFHPSLFTNPLTPLLSTVLATSYPPAQLPSILILTCPPHPPTLLPSTHPSSHTATHPPTNGALSLEGLERQEVAPDRQSVNSVGVRLRVPRPLEAESI